MNCLELLRLLEAVATAEQPTELFPALFAASIYANGAAAGGVLQRIAERWNVVSTHGAEALPASAHAAAILDGVAAQHTALLVADDACPGRTTLYQPVGTDGDVPVMLFFTSRVARFDDEQVALTQQVAAHGNLRLCQLAALHPSERNDHATERQRMLEAVVLNLSDGVIIVYARGNDRHRPLQFANPAFREMTGYSEADIRTATPDLLKGPLTDFSLVLQLLQRAQRGERDQAELVCYRKDGSPFWATVDLIPVLDAKQQPDYLVMVIRDVSRRRQAETVLRDSEEKYRLLFENSKDAILITDDEGRMVQVNTAACDLLGYSREQLSQLTAADLLGVTLERLLAYLALTYIQGYHVGELDIRRPNGDVRVTEYVLCKVAPHLHMTMLRDITERKLAEVDLRAAYAGLDVRVQQRTVELVQLNRDLETEIRERQSSEERYRTLVETSPSAILLTDLQGVIRFCNQRAAALFGYAQVEDLYGINGSDLVDASMSHTASVRMILEPQQSRNIEYLMVRNNGERFHAEASSSIVAIDGRPASLIIVVHDVSERKQAEEALTAAYHHVESLNRHLNNSHTLLQALFDGLDDGLLLLDARGQVQVMNRTLAALLNVTVEDVLGQPWATVYQQAAPDFPGNLALHSATIGHQQSQQHRYYSPHIGTRILDFQIIALGAHEHVEQTILHVIDVTDTVRLQEQVIRAEHFAASGRLAASVAHEINTPLQTIQTNLKLLERTLGPEHRPFMADALEEIRRVGRIVRQLLDFYRPAANSPGPIDLGALIERILLLLGKRIRDQHVAVTHTISADLPALHGRADELTQVILNLVVNALDALPNGGRLQLTVDSSPSGEQLTIAVSDSGPGIPPALHEQIFEAFVTTKEHGTGLGLSISKQIVEAHGGTIRVSSEHEQGSTFVVTLPLERGLGAGG